MYLTYNEYQNYGGTLDETTFMEFEWEAETVINWFTFDRLKQDDTFDEAVKRCAYKLIKLAELKAQSLVLGESASASASGTATSSVSPRFNHNQTTVYPLVITQLVRRIFSSNFRQTLSVI